MLTEVKQVKSVFDNGFQNTAAIIVAGGSSSRMNGLNKLFCEIRGIPVIARTLIAYQSCGSVGSITVAARECDIPDIQKLCARYEITKLTDIVAGGTTRTQSVRNAVKAAGNAYEYLAIADGARPLIKPDTIDKVIDEAMRCGAAACAVRVTDTIKISDGNGFIESTPARDTLWAAQTPQVFRTDLYTAALASDCENYTDDCALMEANGTKVKLVEGDYDNIKITTQTDLAIAEALLEGM